MTWVTGTKEPEQTKELKTKRKKKQRKKSTNEKMVKTHSYEDRQSLLETGGGRIQKPKIIIITVIIKTETDEGAKMGGG